MALIGDVAVRHRNRLDFRYEWSVVRGMRGAPKKTAQSISPEAVLAEIERFAGLCLKDLRVAWAAEFSRDPPKGLWRELLLRTLARRLQEKALGGHDKATQRFMAACGQKKAGDVRCQRLKGGTVLVREFQGTRHTVTIVSDGFVWQEKMYLSLSAIARIITGTNWNGPRFFGLREGGSREADKPQQGRAA